MANKRRRYDNKSAMAAGVDHLLRQQGRLSKVPSTIGTAGASTTETIHPIDPTFLVAAFNARTAIRNVADYRCNGTDDQVEIQLALDALPTGGGRVVLTEGTFTLTSPGGLGANAGIVDMPDYSSLTGMGASTILDIDSTAGGTLHHGVKMGLHCEVAHLTCDISSTSNNLVALNQSGQRCTIHDCWFTGMAGSGGTDLWYAIVNNNGVMNNCFLSDIEAGGD